MLQQSCYGRINVIIDNWNFVLKILILLINTFYLFDKPIFSLGFNWMKTTNYTLVITKNNIVYYKPTFILLKPVLNLKTSTKT